MNEDGHRQSLDEPQVLTFDRDELDEQLTILMGY